MELRNDVKEKLDKIVNEAIKEIKEISVDVFADQNEEDFMKSYVRDEIDNASLEEEVCGKEEYGFDPDSEAKYGKE